MLNQTAAVGTEKFETIFVRRSLILMVALLLGETTINYIDRQVLSVLAPTLRQEFHLSNSQYALILNCFQAVYAVSYTLAGWVLDRIGVGRGLTLAVTWWSIAGMLTAMSRGVASLGFFRGLLAVGEGGAWPSFAKAIATWVPPEARTLAIGVCNSGSSLGTMIAAPMVAWLTVRFGWRSAFVATGAIGLAWVLCFQWFRMAHPQMAVAERAPKVAADKVRWVSLLGYRQTWAVFFCRFLADPLWYFYVFWIPNYLSSQRGLNLKDIGWVAWIPFLFADVSNFTSGYVTLRLQRAGWSVNRTRKTLMVFSALLSPIGIFAVFQESLFWTMGLISIAVFVWMFWSVTVHSLSGDYFPPRAVASVYGIAGTGSTLGSVISTWAIGQVVDATHNYVLAFVGIGALMPIALVVGFLLMRKVEPVPDFAD